MADDTKPPTITDPPQTWVNWVLAHPVSKGGYGAIVVMVLWSCLPVVMERIPAWLQPVTKATLDAVNKDQLAQQIDAKLAEWVKSNPPVVLPPTPTPIVADPEKDALKKQVQDLQDAIAKLQQPPPPVVVEPPKPVEKPPTNPTVLPTVEEIKAHQKWLEDARNAIDELNKQLNANNVTVIPPPPVVPDAKPVTPGTKHFDVWVVEDATVMRTVTTASILNNLANQGELKKRGHEFHATDTGETNAATEYAKRNAVQLPAIAVYDRDAKQFVSVFPLPTDLGLARLAAMGG